MAQRPARSPAPPTTGPTSPHRSNAGSRLSQRSSIETDSDTASQYAPQPLNVTKRTRGYPLPHFSSQQNASSTSINQVRPSGEARRMSPSIGAALGHRPRQHSQGYFEPSLPSTNTNPHLDPSRIAAQAAVQHLNVSTQHIRRRSSTVPFNEPEQEPRRNSYGSVSSDGQSPVSAVEVQYKNGLVGNNNAATAAQAVWKAPEKEVKKGFRDKFRTKHINIMKDKGVDKPLPSPNKPTSGLAKVYNASTTSLADMSSNNSSMYNLQNNSVNTIIPIDEKKKHTGLRQKLKLKDKDDFAGQLSSANSNSRPVDIHNPQTLYNFAPSSPGHSSGFAKSVSDLRHKKKDKLEQVHSRESDGSEWPNLSTSLSSEAATPYSRELKETLAVFGLNNMTPDDAWEFLKARLLVVFEGEHVPIAVEDLNKLVTIHIQRCVAKRDPSIIIGDLDNLLHTGFSSLHHTLRGLHDERLVPNLVQMWMEVFGNVLPFMQAVFLPLDQDFKGRGSVLKTPDMAAEFWGALPSPESVGRLSSSPSSQAEEHADIAAGEELEVRRMLLMSFRDHVILPRFDLLKTTFSRLSLDSINATLAHFQNDSGRARGDSLGRDNDKISSSYSSQTSTLMGTPNRSRATSNLSSGSAQDVAFQSFSSPPAARAGDTSSAQITETVARMLQCLSVLSSVQSGDESQAKLEELTKELKLNWLGRGRTGRNRKGFVGSRQRQVRSIASTIRPEGLGRLRDSREGSPTPTPTRQGTVSRQEGRLVETAA